MAEHPSDPSQENAHAREEPARERRARHRVNDDQKTGQGSLSALSKLKMMERKRAAVSPARED